MRLIHYYVMHKETGEKVYANSRSSRCEEFLETLEDKENYFIGYRWISI